MSGSAVRDTAAAARASVCAGAGAAAAAALSSHPAARVGRRREQPLSRASRKSGYGSPVSTSALGL